MFRSLSEPDPGMGLLFLLAGLGLVVLLSLAACGKGEPTKVIVLTAVTPSGTGTAGSPTRVPTVTPPPERTAPPAPTQPPVTPVSLPVADPAWVDTDGDGFPDELESRMGTDPFTDECLAEVDCGPAQVSKLGRAWNVVLVLDSSAAVERKLEGVLLVDLIGEAALTYAYSLPWGINVAVVAYGGTDAEHVYPLGPVDRETYRVVPFRLTPKGNAPVGRAVEEAVSILAGQRGQNNYIVLVSSSGDTCGTDLCALSETIRASPQDFSLHIQTIGLDVAPAAREQIRCLSDATSSLYFEARSIREFRQAWDTLLRQVTLWARTSSCMAPNHLAFSKCLSRRLTEYVHWSQESGFMQEQTEYAAALMQEINARIVQEQQLDMPSTGGP